MITPPQSYFEYLTAEVSRKKEDITKTRVPCFCCGEAREGQDPLVIFKDTGFGHTHCSVANWNPIELIVLKLGLLSCSEGRQSKTDASPLTTQIVDDVADAVFEYKNEILIDYILEQYDFKRLVSPAKLIEFANIHTIKSDTLKTCIYDSISKISDLLTQKTMLEELAENVNLKPSELIKDYSQYIKFKKSPQAIYKTIVRNTLEMFRDESGLEYVRFTENHETKLYAVDSNEFRNYVGRQVAKVIGISKPDYVKSILQTIKAAAALSSQKVTHLGVMRIDDANFAYQTASDKAIKLDLTTGQITEIETTDFKCYDNQIFPPIDFNGTEKNVTSLTSDFAAFNDGDQKLLTCYIVASFIPDIQMPIVLLVGAAGCTKTTVSSIIKKICDPHDVDTIKENGAQMPKDPKDLFVKAKTNRIIQYDNESKLTQEQQNLACQFATGTKSETRQLFTNSEQHTIRAQRAQIMTYISMEGGLREDFINRSINCKASPITRKSESELIQLLAQKLPLIRGGILKTLPQAYQLQLLVENKDISPPIDLRMVDFGKWVIYISAVLFPDFDMIEHLEAKVKDSRLDALGDNPVVRPLLAVIEKGFNDLKVKEIKFNAQDLYEKCISESYTLKSECKTSNSFGARLSQIEHLLSKSYKITKSRDIHGAVYTFTKNDDLDDPQKVVVKVFSPRQKTQNDDLTTSKPLIYNNINNNTFLHLESNISSQVVKSKEFSTTKSIDDEKKASSKSSKIAKTDRELQFYDDSNVKPALEVEPTQEDILAAIKKDPTIQALQTNLEGKRLNLQKHIADLKKEGIIETNAGTYRIKGVSV